jgi:dipeptidyl aminopeptidase/acylaminoacyl peptidase
MRFLFAVMLLASAAPALADDDLAARFAARPAATSVVLSPLGDKVAYIGAYKTGGKAVFVADLTTGDSHPMLAGSTLEMRPYHCGFKTETRLVCTVYGVAGFGAGNGGYTRVIAVDIDGKNIKMLSQRPGVKTEATFGGGEIRNWLPDDPDHILMQVDVGYTETVGSLIKAPEEGVGAAIVDVRSGTQRLVEKSSAKVAEVFADGAGNIRLRATVAADPDGLVRDRFAYSVRAKGSRDWRGLLRTTISDDRATEFAGFDESGDHLYQLASLDGRKALFAVATDGSGTRTLVYSRDDVDVDGVARIGKYDRPVGATYATERGLVHYFDPELAKLSASLAKALPGHPAVSIVDESWDGTRKLIFADGNTAPGHYYLYDATTRKLGPLMAVYPGLDGVAIGVQKAVTYAARDGTKIPGFLTLPPGRTDARGLPGIVMPHGGPSSRDSAGFEWLPQFFAAQGYAVLQPNYRGSSGYGDAFAATNAYQSWPLAIGDVNDGGRWLIAQGVDPKKLAIVGWSYGGYAALQANVVDPALYRATIAIAPVTDLELLRTEAQRNGSFKIRDAEIGNGPHVFAGSPARHAGAFVAPVLMFHGDKDLNVEIEQSRFMASQLRGAGKKVELVEFKNLDHQLDDSAVRAQMLAKSAAFLKEAVN